MLALILCSDRVPDLRPEREPRSCLLCPRLPRLGVSGLLFPCRRLLRPAAELSGGKVEDDTMLGRWRRSAGVRHDDVDGAEGPGIGPGEGCEKAASRRWTIARLAFFSLRIWSSYFFTLARASSCSLVSVGPSCSLSR